MQNVMPINEARIKDHIRIVLDDNNRFCPIFWVEVGDDGSIYFGIRRKNASILKEGRKQVTESDVNIGYDEGNIIEDKIIKKNTKISYHASGIVNFVNRRFSIDNLRHLTKNRLIAVLLFEELAKFSIISKKKIKDKDVVCKYNNSSNIDPLVGQLYVIPLLNNKIQEYCFRIILSLFFKDLIIVYCFGIAISE